MAEPQLQPVPYPQFLTDVATLAAAIEGGDWIPGYLVGIGRGGLVPATFLSHRLDVPLLSLDLSAALPAFGVDLIAQLAAMTRAATRLLLIDDINDSGATIAQLRDLFAFYGAEMAQLRVAVLIDNVGSRAMVDYRARTIDRATEKSWFVFPWEAAASRETLVNAAGTRPERLA